jgi:hypothetical protein
MFALGRLKLLIFHFPRLDGSQENWSLCFKMFFVSPVQATKGIAWRSKSDIDVSDDVATTTTAAAGSENILW